MFFTAGALDVVIIKDKNGKDFLHILYKDNKGELILKFPSRLKLPEDKFLSMGRDRVISLSNGIAYKTTIDI